MRASFFPKLALDGIRKNKRLYLPYMLTGCIMVSMFYILLFLPGSPAISHMRGGSVLNQVLPLGACVIAAFSLLFLFYTNSFLIKRRYNELGLYNILGMDKMSICKILFWESVVTSSSAIFSGLITGIILSKAAELMLLKLLDLQAIYTLSIGPDAVKVCLMVYFAIYSVILVSTLIKAIKLKPLELMQSSRVGERVQKSTAFWALLGTLCLAVAYYIAVTTEDVLNAFGMFLIAVILVIIGTYLLFISGSVVFCRMLQKNKKYYYNKRHFVSVSSMVYRMKRNGAGLASICILLTMVLVMISSSACLYFGAEDATNRRCPKDVNIFASFHSITGLSDENLDKIRDLMKKHCADGTDLEGMCLYESDCMIGNTGVTLTRREALSKSEKRGYVVVISLDDYNKSMDKSESLKENECLIFCSRLKRNWDSFEVESCGSLTVKKHIDKFTGVSDTASYILPTVCLVVSDPASYLEPAIRIKYEGSDVSILNFNWSCGFDIEEDGERNEKKIIEALKTEIDELNKGEENNLNLYRRSLSGRKENRENFYDMYGSLFFIGIMLSLIFLMAAVIIIYYKQISEGYEDAGRFEIMKKIGMTKRDIKRSINSQMLTVFFLPLIFAGMHLAFAFPLVIKILLMFEFYNTLLSIAVNAACFMVFAIFYALVYKITSGGYFTIVNKGTEK